MNRLLSGVEDPEISQTAEHVEACAACQAELDVLTDPIATQLGSLTKQQQRLWHLAFASISDELPTAVGGLSNSLLSLSPACLVPVETPELPGYEFIGAIAAGGMGTVFQAKHLKLGRDVAIKLMRPSRDPRLAMQFEQEMKAVGQLSDVHVVQAYDAGECNGIPYLVMELLDGCDLGKFTRVEADADRLPIETVCDYIGQAARGLQTAHDAGMVHRDVKPENLMLTSDGVVKVLDLGLASMHAPSDYVGADVAVVGSLDYISPEQGCDHQDAAARSDIYSLGCTLYALLAGKPPFSGPKYRSAATKMLAHACAERPDLQEVRSDLPPKLVDLVQSMMSVDPAERPQSASEVAKRLSIWAERKPIRQWLSGNGPLIGAGFLGLLVFLGVIIIKFADGTSMTITTDKPVVNIELSQAEPVGDGALEGANNTPKGTPDAEEPSALDSNVLDPSEYPQLVASLQPAQQLVYAFCFDTDLTGAFYINTDGQVQRWDFASGESTLLHQYSAPRTGKLMLHSQDGEELVFGNSMGISKLNVATGEIVWARAGSGNVWGALVADETMILRGRLHDMMMLRHSDGGVVYQAEMASHDPPSFSRDGQRMVFVLRRTPVLVSADFTKVFGRDDVLKWQIENFTPKHVAFSHDESHLICTSATEIVLWDLAAKEVTRRYHTKHERPQEFLRPLGDSGLFLTLRGAV
ncbi:MAG: protein kinase, partial [Rubripirellula sp.]